MSNCEIEDIPVTGSWQTVAGFKDKQWVVPGPKLSVSYGQNIEYVTALTGRPS